MLLFPNTYKSYVYTILSSIVYNSIMSKNVHASVKKYSIVRKR